MIDKNETIKTIDESSTASSNLMGFYAAIFTAIITVITFGFAMAAIPISGANCSVNCASYPYLGTFSQYPKDFIWMQLAVLMLFAYVTLMATIHFSAPGQKKIFGQVGLSFALIAAALLLGNYYIQFSTIPMSLKSNETEGLALLIQYNSHGVFIALEELGYLVMALSFLFMAPVFANRNRLETAIRWIFIVAFIVVIVSFLAFSIIYGLDRLDRFEVIALSVDWLVLIVNGILLSVFFRKRMKETEE